MPNIENNRQLMVEQIKRLKLELNETKREIDFRPAKKTKVEKVNDIKGAHIARAIRINFYDMFTLIFDKKQPVADVAAAFVPPIKNTISMVLKHKYKPNPNIEPQLIARTGAFNDRQGWYRNIKSMNDIQKMINKFKNDLKSIDVELDKFQKKPSMAAASRLQNMYRLIDTSAAALMADPNDLYADSLI
jgi:hypothetical protein